MTFTMVRLSVALAATVLLSSSAYGSLPPTIAFVAVQSEGMHIFVVTAEGDAPRRLTSGPGQNQSPRYSFDGRRIVFTSNRRGRWQIFLMRANGTGQRALSSGPRDDLFPAWSPDGTRVVYVSRRGDDEQIYVMHADGRAPRRLTSRPGRNTVPVWSPDGRWIAYVSRRGDEEPDLSLSCAPTDRNAGALAARFSCGLECSIPDGLLTAGRSPLSSRG